eukprot:s3611_g4.t1
MPKAKISPNVICYSAVISACEKGGQWEQALSLFQAMPKAQISPNVISYSAAISACEKGGQWEQALTLFETMLSSQVDPNIVSYNALLDCVEIYSNNCLGGEIFQNGFLPMLQATSVFQYLKVDLHDLSEGAARLALQWWLSKTVARRLEVCDRLDCIVVTGYGKSRRAWDTTDIKAAALDLLSGLGLDPQVLRKSLSCRSFIVARLSPLVMPRAKDEDLEWELERKTVSCNALLDGKLEELFGVEGTGAAKQRRQELREREEKRVERAKKRKAWRESEFAAELDRLEASEMALREAEKLRDAEDREKEEFELSEKQRKEMKLEKLEAHHGIVRSVHVAQLADNQALMDLVHKVQEEPREELFTIKLDTAYLRNERILERKLRPWLERKVDLHMGGQSSDLVELILRRVNGAAQPDPLIAELERFLDDFAEPLVERLWRMLALELIQNGLVLPTVAKRQKKEEIKDEKL